MGGSQRMRPAHFFVADKCLHVYHANVCTAELCVYASFCYKHISIWRKFARIQLKCSICVSK